jgi:hypothetical protein
LSAADDNYSLTYGGQSSVHQLGEFVMADYVLEGPKWGPASLGTAGGTVTWAVDGTIPAFFLNDLSAALLIGLATPTFSFKK